MIAISSSLKGSLVNFLLYFLFSLSGHCPIPKSREHNECNIISMYCFATSFGCFISSHFVSTMLKRYEVPVKANLNS